MVPQSVVNTIVDPSCTVLVTNRVLSQGTVPEIRRLRVKLHFVSDLQEHLKFFFENTFKPESIFIFPTPKGKY